MQIKQRWGFIYFLGPFKLITGRVVGLNGYDLGCDNFDFMCHYI